MEPSYAEEKVISIDRFVRSPTNKLYAIFLNYTVRIFDEVLLQLQAEEPRVHTMRGSFQKLVQTILSRFVKPSAVQGKAVDTVDYRSKYNLKPNKELVIGEAAEQFIAQAEENQLRPARVEEFYSCVVEYFKVSFDYLKAKLPLNEPLLIHAEVADVDPSCS